MKYPAAHITRKIKSIRHHYLDKFIFIHINKTGGSSVEKALKLPFEHITALEKIEKNGLNNWNNKLSFTVIRNPWDKVVSHYHYRLLTNQTKLKDNPVTFKNWVKYAYGDQDPFYYDIPKMFMPQIDWIADQSGKILVNEIIRFEHLNDGFSRVMKSLGKNIILPHVNSSKRGSYKDYYDAETAQIIRNWFERDIELFKYEL